MTRVRFDDLPARVQAQIRAGSAAVAPSPSRKRRTVASGPATWRCHTCGHTTDVWAHAERHAHDHGHVRIELVV